MRDDHVGGGEVSLAGGGTGFSAEHLRALCAYRDLATAVGPVAARRVMREVRHRSAADAAALVCSLHSLLDAEREQALAARGALEAIRAETATEVAPVEADSMSITELSRALGVRASTLRFWEAEGLVVPDRLPSRAGSVRSYGLGAVREARITVALRAGGYGVPEVRKAITAVRELHDAGGSVEALDARLAAIAARALALLRAGAALAEIIEAVGGAPSGRAG